MNRSRRLITVLTLGILAMLLGARAGVAGSQPQDKQSNPRVEVVFCLDTTGSMGKLISAARRKIWSISNQVAAGKPTPRLFIGLVAYRDRGDDYITKSYELTEDLDEVYGHLMEFKADGGGDFPESVNQALHEAVRKMNWSENKNTLKIIFLVGDAPPHTKYQKDVPYQMSCQSAKNDGIIINTVQCGNHAVTKKYWQEIAKLANGSYVVVSPTGGPDIVAESPYDEELSKINRALTNSTLPFGDEDHRRQAEAKKQNALELSKPAAASRVGYASKTGQVAVYDLLDNINAGKVKLEKLKREELPVPLQKLNLKEQKAFLEKVQFERSKLKKRATELDAKRDHYLKEQRLQQTPSQIEESFDQQVLQILQEQAKRANIRYEAQPKKK